MSNASTAKQQSFSNRSHRADALREPPGRQVERDELARYAAEVVVSAAVAAVATEGGWLPDAMSVCMTLPAIELLRQEKLESLEAKLTELCSAEGLPRGIQGALNRWLLVQNVQLAVAGAAVTDPIIPDIFLSVRACTTVSGCSAIEPGLHKELTGKGMGTDSADRVCHGLAESASTAARCIAFFRSSETNAVAMSSCDDSTSGVIVSHDGDVTRLLWSCERPTKQNVPLPPFDDRGAQVNRPSQYKYEIHRLHYDKMRALYVLHNTPKRGMQQQTDNDYQDWPLQLLHTRLFCVCVRYQLYLCSRNQGACPRAFFEYLRAELGVEQECFASPWNVTLARYCSAHPDLERSFGSCGSFFSEFKPTSGSFEANPPFCEMPMAIMAHAFEMLLADSGRGPLSFVVVVPAWTNSEAFLTLKGSRFLRRMMTLGYANAARTVSLPTVQSTAGFNDLDSHPRSVLDVACIKIMMHQQQG